MQPDMQLGMVNTTWMSSMSSSYSRLAGTVPQSLGSLRDLQPVRICVCLNACRSMACKFVKHTRQVALFDVAAGRDASTSAVAFRCSHSLCLYVAS
jgi:hypothetical protein